MAKISILNNSDMKSTIKALGAIGKKADAKGQKVINSLIRDLQGSQKEDAVKKRRVSKTKTTVRRRRRTNPTTAATMAGHHRRPGGFRRRARAAGASIGARLKGVNITGLLVRGGCMAGGFLAQSFVARQSERILPGLPRMAHAAIGSAVVAAVSLMIGGGKAWAEDIAAAGVAGGIQAIAHEMAPGVFAGLHEGDVYTQGYSDGASGAYAAVNGLGNPDVLEDRDTQPGFSGLAYTDALPSGIRNRPSFL